MRIQQTLGAIVLASAIGLTGCAKSKEPEYIYGTVLKEAGTIADKQRVIERSEGAYFGNDSVRFGDPTYAIQFKADNGNVYTFEIKKNQRKLEALNLAIEEGTRIRIEKYDFDFYLKGTVGMVWDFEIEVLGKK